MHKKTTIRSNARKTSKDRLGRTGLKECRIEIISDEGRREFKKKPKYVGGAE